MAIPSIISGEKEQLKGAFERELELNPPKEYTDYQKFEERYNALAQQGVSEKEMSLAIHQADLENKLLFIEALNGLLDQFDPSMGFVLHERFGERFKIYNSVVEPTFKGDINCENNISFVALDGAIITPTGEFTGSLEIYAEDGVTKLKVIDTDTVIHIVTSVEAV